MEAVARVLPEQNFALEARLKQHVLETSCPETAPGLDWSPPPKGQAFVIVWDYELVPNKRLGRERAPCPVCSPHHPKYFLGSLAWWPLEGVYRCIGRECAGRSIGHAQAAAARKAYEDKRAHDADFEFAFDNLGHIPAIARYLQALLPATQRAEGLLHALGRARMRKRLYDTIRSTDGRLRVWDVKKVEREDPFTGEVKEVDESYEISLGMARGYEVLGNTFRPTASIRRELGPLSALNFGEQEDAQNWVYAHGYEGRNELRLIRLSVTRAREVRRKSMIYLDQMREFFSESTFESLARFGSDRRNGHPFFAESRSGIYRVGETALRAIRIRPDFGEISRLPPWPDALR